MSRDLRRQKLADDGKNLKGNEKREFEKQIKEQSDAVDGIQEQIKAEGKLLAQKQG